MEALLMKTLIRDLRYKVSRRQQQVAKHSPSEVIELAFLSALLERRQETLYSQRFTAIKTFFKNAVSVVPLESLFFAMTKGRPEVMLQCCEIFTKGNIPLTNQPSEFLISGMKQAIARIRHFQSEMREIQLIHNRFQGKPSVTKEASAEELIVHQEIRLSGNARSLDEQTLLRYADLKPVMDETIHRLIEFLRGNKIYRHEVCNINLEVIYPSTEARKMPEHKPRCSKAPNTLLKEGWKKIKEINDNIIAEHSGPSAESVTSKTNSMMLTTLNGLRNEFRTCSTLLGAFMESQVQIPLKKHGGDTYVNKIANHASSFGLSVWGLLILPFQYVSHMIGNLSEEFGQFVIEFSRKCHDLYDTMFPPMSHQFPDYDEKLEFLVGSMNQSSICNREYVSYSLERQLKDQCSKRKIFHNTPLKEILEEWHANFENETLTLVPSEYRPLVARWIKWSLMINNLRESLASQIAVGVIGLVNSGKSKFVRSMFGKETITGTTDTKRTTVPLIYNLNPEIKGMDVIDFPGVDDRDKSIPKLAELLLSLTRIVIFVVDYRRAHTESTKEWLSILAKENIPVLVCLTFADKLYAELMGKKEDCDAEKLKSAVEDHLKSKNIKIFA